MRARTHDPANKSTMLYALNLHETLNLRAVGSCPTLGTKKFTIQMLKQVAFIHSINVVASSCANIIHQSKVE